MSQYQVFLVTLKTPIAIITAENSGRAQHAKVLKVAYNEGSDRLFYERKKSPTLQVNVLSILAVKSTDESLFNSLSEPVVVEIRRDNILANQSLGDADQVTEAKINRTR
jgi:hypothetical protein